MAFRRRRTEKSNRGSGGDLGADDRIEELEAQVSELKSLVEVLLARPHLTEESDTDEVPSEPYLELEEQLPLPHHDGFLGRHYLMDEMRESVSRALGGEAGESLETRIGGIWLSRIAVILVMTALAIGGTITIQEETIQPIHKIAIGYTLAVCGIGYGLFRRRQHNIFAQTMLGFGLAVLYFTTYASFFLQYTSVFQPLSLATPSLAACLLLLGLVSHYSRSESAAGIALFLIYYTVVLSLNDLSTIENFYYAMATCTMLPVAALVFHWLHRWLYFTWAALIASHGTYLLFLYEQPPALDMGPRQYFWVSFGFLSLVWFVFSVACVTDARKTGEYRRSVAPMAAVNSAVYFWLTWVSVGTFYPEWEWAFRLAMAGALAVLALYARWAGPRHNYLFQLFAAKTFILLTLALEAYFTHEWFLIAMAVESLALGVTYRRSGLVVFKLLGIVLLMVTFAGCLISIRLPGSVDLWGYVVPANWFLSVGVATVFCVVAWFYEHFVRRVPPEEREVRSQWFLADSLWDMKPATVALLHATAAALILMAITILQLGEEPTLPYVLTAEGIVMALVGLLLRTPQVQIASVLLLIASHVCYHVFLLLDMPGFETQENYLAYTVAVALLTYIGGYLWERYLRNIEGGSAVEHHALASVPYIAATLLLTTLMQRNLTPMYAPLAQNLLGVALMLGGSATLLAGLRICSTLAFALGTASFLHAIYSPGYAPVTHPDFFICLVFMLGTYALGERLTTIWSQKRSGQSRVANALRSVFVSVAAVVGLIGLWEWAPPDQVTLYWLGHAVGAMALGVVLMEGRYRWAALFIYILAIVRAYAYDLSNLNPLLQFLVFAALSVPLLLFSWGYALWRDRQLQRLHAEQAADQYPDE